MSIAASAGARGAVAEPEDVTATSGTLITLAPTGAESAKADVPALPVTVEEVVDTARDCRSLGAAVLHLDGMSEALPAPGTPVTSGSREVGRVGTAVRHHELGVIALALVKQSVTPETPLKVGEAAAAIDPDDHPQDVDAAVAAARDRVRAVRSATMRG